MQRPLSVTDVSSHRQPPALAWHRSCAGSCRRPSTWEDVDGDMDDAGATSSSSFRRGSWSVSARSQPKHPPKQQDDGPVVARAEHISMESDHDYLAAPRPARRKVRSTYALRSRLRGCETELSLLEDHWLSVRSVRPDG